MHANQDNDEQKQSSNYRADEDIRQEDTQRRGWFAPIVLVLLVLSLIGNVYLYSDKLQQGKADREEAGLRIMQDAQTFHNTVQTMIDRLDSFGQADSVEGRMLALQDLGGAAESGTASLKGLLVVADGHGGREPLTLNETITAYSFMTMVNENLFHIGSNAGLLNEEDASFVAMLQASLAEIESIAAKFDFPAEPTEMMALQAAGGGAWVDIVYELVAAMGQVELRSLQG